MYAYTSGSPGTYGCETNGRLAGFAGGPDVYMRGPGFGTYLQTGRPLSYAPRFDGLGCPGIMQRGGMLGLGAEQTPAPAAATSWADVIGGAVGGLASIFTLSTQQKMAKQAQHSAERTAALNAQTAATQAAFFPGVAPAPAGAPAGGGMGTTVLIVGGLFVAGGVAWMLTRRRRR